MDTHELVLKYMPLANKLAYDKKRVLPRHVDVEELQSAAYLGLVEAANRFDEGRGIAFSTFAYPRISGAIVDHLRQQSWGKRSDPKAVYSLDIPISDDNMAMKDTLVAKEETNSDEMLEVVSKELDKQAEQVMRSYFIDDCSMKEVGEKFGVSESRISQLISKYKACLRDTWSETELRIELAA